MSITEAVAALTTPEKGIYETYEAFRLAISIEGLSGDAVAQAAALLTLATVSMQLPQDHHTKHRWFRFT